MKNKFKKTLTGTAIAAALSLSVGLPVFAATATTSFSYAGKTVNCQLIANWGWGTDDGTAKTYVNGGSGNYPLGAYCNAYSNGTLLGGNHSNAFDYASVTIHYSSDEFRSSHNIQNSNRVPLKSTKITLTD